MSEPKTMIVCDHTANNGGDYVEWEYDHPELDEPQTVVECRECFERNKERPGDVDVFANYIVMDRPEFLKKVGPLLRTNLGFPDSGDEWKRVA